MQDAIGRINGMQILYEKLLICDGHESILVQNYVKSFTDAIFALLSDDLQVTSKVEIDDFSLTPKILSPLGIIINELLTNIMKHAFKGRKSGKIDISLRNSRNRITLTIQDNGSGLPKGFDAERSNGFSLMP